MDKMQLRAVLLRAASAEIGVIVSTNNVDLLRQKLYKCMRDDASIPKFSLVTDPAQPTTRIFIIKAELINGSPEES